MSAKSVSTESHRCLSFLNFNSFNNELLNEVHSVFIDQNTWQLNTHGNGVCRFLVPLLYITYILYAAIPAEIPQSTLPMPRDRLWQLLVQQWDNTGHTSEGDMQNKIKVTRKVSCDQNGQITKPFEFTKLRFTNWRHTMAKTKQRNAVL